MIVFVYGTLMRGYANNCCLEGAEFLSEATTVARFAMTNRGFPYIFPDPKGKLVRGEIWDIGSSDKILAGLDALEGEGKHYDRVVIKAADAEGRVRTVSAYQATASVWKKFASSFLPCPTDDRGRYYWESTHARAD